MSFDGCQGTQTVTEIKKPNTPGRDVNPADSGALSVTKEAAKYVEALLAKEGKESWGLKIEVVPGGCAGYRYFMGFQQGPENGEKTLSFHGVKLFLSQESVEMLGASKIEYIATLEASGLRVNNPNATRTCGCGKSFG